MPLLSTTDASLVTRALSGRDDAFETLILRYHRQATAIARAHGVPSFAIDDALQDAFLQAFRSLPGLREPARFGSWFYAIVRNAARRHRRRADDVAIPENLEISTMSPASAVERQELRENLRRNVDALPDGIREAIFLYYYEGEPTRSVARALGTSRAAVKKRLQKGRQILREELWRALDEDLRELLPSQGETERKARSLGLLIVTGPPATAGGTPSPEAGSAAKGSPGATVSISGGALLKLQKVVVPIVVGSCLLVGVLVLLTRDPSTPGGTPGGASAPTSGSPALSQRAAAPSGAEEVPAAVDDGVHRPQPLRIRIVSEDGASIADATLRLRWYTREGVGGRLTNPGSFAEVRQRSPEGDFLVREIAGNAIVVVAAAPRHQARREVHDLSREEETVVIELQEDEPLRLRLIAPLEDDRPVGGASVGRLVSSEGSAPERIHGYPPANFGVGEPGFLFTTSTDGNGKVTLGRMPGTLWAAREGYGPTVIRLYADHRPDPDVTYAVPMYPPTTLRVSVRYEDGEPVERFRLGLSERVEAVHGREIEGPVTEREIHHLCSLSPHARLLEHLIVGVDVDGTTATSRVKIEYGQTTDVELVVAPRPTTVSGRVLDSEGRAVSGARVAATTCTEFLGIQDGTFQGRPDGATESDVDGSYAISLTGRPEPIYLLVTHPDHGFFFGERLHLAVHGETRYDVRFATAATIAARLAESVEEREGVGIELTNDGSLAHPMIQYRRKVRTDSAGRATFDRVQPGAWTLSWTDDTIIRRLPIVARPGRHHELILGDDARRGALEVAGYALERGKPVEGLTLWLHGGGHFDDLLGIAVTDRTGAFRLSPASPGTHVLALRPSDGAPGFPLHYFRADIAATGEPIELDVTRTELTGRVVSSEGPLDTVTVKPYTPQLLDGRERLASFHRAQTDAAGRFRLAGLYQIPTLLVFQKEGFIERRLEWVPDGSLTSRLGEVMLSPAGDGGRVSIRVIDAETGREIPRVLAEVTTADLPGPLAVGRPFRTSLDEEIALSSLPTGRYRVFVRPGSLGAQEYTSEEAGFDHVAGVDREVVIRARPAGSVELLLAADNGPVPPAVVEVTDARGEPVLSWRGTPRLHFRGSAPLMGLPLEEVTVRVTATGWKTLEFPLRVAAGRVERIVRSLERE